TLPEVSPADVGHSLVTTRDALERRAVLVAADRAELLSAPLITDAVAEGKTAWLFPGQGSQRLGMGRELAQTFPVFAQAMEGALAGFGDDEIGEVIWSDPERVDQTQFTQCGLFAIEVATARLLQS